MAEEETLSEKLTIFLYEMYKEVEKIDSTEQQLFAKAFTMHSGFLITIVETMNVLERNTVQTESSESSGDEWGP